MLPPDAFPLDLQQEDLESRLRRTNHHMQLLEDHLQHAPDGIAELLAARREQLSNTQRKIEQIQAENQQLQESVVKLSKRNVELESLASATSSEFQSAYHSHEIKDKAIAAEGELSSLRAEVRALTLKQNELRMTKESLEKTLQRKDAQILDDTTSAVAQLQKVQQQVDEEAARHATLKRHLSQRDDCSSMLLTMQSRVAELRSMLDDYATQTDRLHRDFEQLTVDAGEDKRRQQEALRQSEKEVDEAAARCRHMEHELRAQLLSLQDSIASQHDKRQAEVAVLQEIRRMAAEESEDLQRDIDAELESKHILESENARLRHYVDYHRVMDEATEFLQTESEMRHHNAASDSSNGFVIRTTGNSRAAAKAASSGTLVPRRDSGTIIVSTAAPTEQGSSLEDQYLLRLRVRIGVLEREVQRVTAEKDATAAQLEHLCQNVDEEERRRAQELHLLKTEVRSVSFREELKMAKIENISLKAMIQEKESHRVAAEEETEISVASLSRTAAELKRRIAELTSSALDNERKQQESIAEHRNLVHVARKSFELAAEVEARDNGKRSKLSRLLEENERLKEFFRLQVPDKWFVPPKPEGFVEATPSHSAP